MHRTFYRPCIKVTICKINKFFLRYHEKVIFENDFLNPKNEIDRKAYNK